MASDSFAADDAGSAPARGRNRGLLVFVSVLVALLVVVSAADLALSLRAESQRAERVQAAQELVESQQSVISGLMSAYEESAYENEDVDTIYQQQLIASEHILQALSIIALQNSQVIELLFVSR